MRFLIDADLPRSVAALIRRFGYDAVDVRDIHLGKAKDSAIAAYARYEGMCLVTGNFDFADIRNYDPYLPLHEEKLNLSLFSSLAGG